MERPLFGKGVQKREVSGCFIKGSRFEYLHDYVCVVHSFKKGVMEKMLSIIVPVYNAGQDLRNCLDSILSQTFKNFELILVDDGSKDNSGQICDEYAAIDSRLKVIHQANKGQSAARNNGIENAVGKYIGFVDNDDTILPEMFDVLISNALQGDYDISACSFAEVNEEGKYTSTPHDHITTELSNEEGVKQILSREKLNIYVWTKIYKREFLEMNYIRFESGKIDEDVLFNFQAYRKAKMSIVQDVPLYVYHYKSDSACRRILDEDLEKYLSGTWYRVNKIVKETNVLYSQYLYLAKRQKIIYCLQMLSAIFKSELKADNVYYKDIMKFYHNNKADTLQNKKYLGLKYIGIMLLLFLPSKAYFYYKKNKMKFEMNH